MANEIKTIYEKLKNLKDNLLKLNYGNRTEKVLSKKLNEAVELKKQFDACIVILTEQIDKKQIEGSVLNSIQSYCDSFQKLYTDIEEFCTKNYSQGSGDSNQNTSMESFEFRTATSLLPVMTGNENVTKSLIDAIELYNSALKPEGKSMLINFVLKTRLNESAKLRLSKSYKTGEELVEDMRKHLLTKTSFTALQQKLLGCTQNQKSIEEFGKEIEDLFVRLTVSQADGDSGKYAILKSLNETSAIRRFASGLRNSQLSTVITARNYESLKDAISGAKDEQMATTSSEGSVMKFQRGKPFNNFYSYRGRGNRGSNRYINYNSYRGQNNSQRGHPTRGNNRGSGNQQPSGYRGYRPNRYRNFYRGNWSRGNNNMHYMHNNYQNNNTENVCSPDSNQNSEKPNDELMQFFR